MRPIRSPHSRIRSVMTGQRIARGRELARKTQAWMERHEGTFFALYDYVKSLQEQGIGGGRMRDRVAVHCMRSGIDVGDDPYRFGNDYWAGIARYMALYDPSLVGAPLSFNDSDIDCYGLLPVSYLPELGKGGE